MMKTYFSLLLFFSFLCFQSQEIVDKEGFKKCRKEFNKKTCLLDEDGDGILNYLDQCKDIPGPVENYGCPFPDTDGDGRVDKHDTCPTVAGPLENNGCPWPDTDGDGVLDKDDACPTVAGEEKYNGCKEFDWFDCTENIKQEKINVINFVKEQKEINYQALEKYFIEVIKKTKFDSEIMLFLNTRIIEGHFSKCPTLDFSEYREFSTESILWNEKILNKISKTVTKTILPVSSNSLFWGKGGFFKENFKDIGSEFQVLAEAQKTYIVKLPLFFTSEYGKIRYMPINGRKLTKLPKDFNRILFREDKTIINGALQTEINLEITTKTEYSTYQFKYDFVKKDWFLKSEESRKIINKEN